MTLHSPLPSTLGADLRALRKSRRMTLEGVAGALGKSVGWVSQVERDISSPDIEDLTAFARLYGVPLSMLFGQPPTPPREQGRIVRAGARRQIGSRTGGLVEALLSPDLTDDFEVIHSTFAPGARLSVPKSRQTQEVGYLLSGRLLLSLDGEVYDIHPGDSFRIRGETYAWENPGTDPAVAIWVIAPPVY